ncbi:uncharacterized protein ACA1_391590 [Acanthamoeba castellanii str. Neff]|uniref:Uncharacterized protein n=1 Tax=Acanthamoeba castellanii (strain ATCC 30010 / Neff) TaxID=1257118 RepID=L8GQ57_ACACF|nr:uncharacterized protein ACA1_391590 [Acanthamoeba castellanii str. Neff]ELR14788.1 hypothetical protein ACA1_391590 [Acanthamoeba castellanii str. Neff]
MMVVATSAQLFDVPADADQGAPCPGLYPRVICADCQLGCSYCGAYTGTYDQCVGFCHPTWGWAPNTQVKITYFPYAWQACAEPWTVPAGPNSSGGCICSGYTCFPTNA